LSILNQAILPDIRPEAAMVMECGSAADPACGPI